MSLTAELVNGTRRWDLVAVPARVLDGAGAFAAVTDPPFLHLPPGATHRTTLSLQAYYSDTYPSDPNATPLVSLFQSAFWPQRRPVVHFDGAVATKTANVAAGDFLHFRHQFVWPTWQGDAAKRRDILPWEETVQVHAWSLRVTHPSPQTVRFTWLPTPAAQLAARAAGPAWPAVRALRLAGILLAAVLLLLQGTVAIVVRRAYRAAQTEGNARSGRLATRVVVARP